MTCVFLILQERRAQTIKFWDYSLNEAIDAHWCTPRRRAGPTALPALSPKFEIEFGTMTRRASAEGTSIRGVYVGAVQSRSCFLRTGQWKDTTICPSQDVWNENQGSGKQRCQFLSFYFFLFRIQIHSSASNSQQSQQIRGFSKSRSGKRTSPRCNAG